MYKRIIKSKFFTASFWMYVASTAINLGNYLFHLTMGRFLGPQEYGLLASTISLLYIFSIPVLTITLVIIKFTAELKGKGDISGIAGLYEFLKKKILAFGLLSIIILLLCSTLIMQFLHINSWVLIMLIILYFFLSFFPVLNKSILQGMSDFLGLSVTSTIEISSKLLFCILFVYIGFKTEGVFLGIITSAIITYAFSSIYLHKLRQKSKDFIPPKKMYSFALPVFFTTLGLTSIFTTDIILVRHFFSAAESGYYAALSVLGKVIYYAVSPLMGVMFPMVSEKHAKGEKFTHILFSSIGLTLLGALFVVGLYFIFPQFMILLLFGKKFISITPLLGIFGVFIAIYAVASLLANFYLSLHKIVASYLVIISACAQIIVISLFHTTLLLVIEESLVISILLLISLIMYYPVASKK